MTEATTTLTRAAAHGQTAHRGRAKAPKAVRPPITHIATAPDGKAS